MSITFSPAGSASVTVDPIPGTLSLGGGDDDRGGSNIPTIRAGIARNGKCSVIIDSGVFGIEEALLLRSPSGIGNVEITGDATSSQALIDVEIYGKRIQIATISWKGSGN